MAKAKEEEAPVEADKVLATTQAVVGSELPEEGAAFEGVDPGDTPQVASDAPGAGTAALSTGPDGSDVGTGQPAELERLAKDEAEA